MAPYAVRRAYYVREKELEKAYWDGGEAILEGIRERLKDGRLPTVSDVSDEDDANRPVSADAGDVGRDTGFWRNIKAFIHDLRGQRLA